MIATLAARLWNDEAGFIVSAELAIISSIAVIAMIVGLSEVAANVNQELEDVGSAFAQSNQTYQVYGTQGHKGSVGGSSFYDVPDYCDAGNDIAGDTSSQGEGNGSVQR